MVSVSFTDLMFNANILLISTYAGENGSSIRGVFAIVGDVIAATFG